MRQMDDESAVIGGFDTDGGEILGFPVGKLLGSAHGEKLVAVGRRCLRFEGTPP